MAASRFAELAETEATGVIAEIYDEIRIYSGVRYVSSLQRHLATMPGCLEWAWAALRPAMVAGVIPDTAWRVARAIAVPRLPRLTTEALWLLGVDTGSAATVRTVCDNFVRVSPVNLMMASCLRPLLGGKTSAGSGFGSGGWTPPAMLPAPPPMVDVEGAAPDLRSVLLQLSRDLAGQRFVPGPYRMFGHWPAYLAHVATELGPLFDDSEIAALCEGFRQAIEAEAPDIVARLPGLPPGLSPPDAEQKQAVLAALDVYQRTSPEMVVFGRMLGEALPDRR